MPRRTKPVLSLPHADSPTLVDDSVSPAIAPPAPRPSAAGLVRCVVDGNLIKPGRCPVCGTEAK